MILLAGFVIRWPIRGGDKMHDKTVHDTTPHFLKCQRQLLLTLQKMWGWSVPPPPRNIPPPLGGFISRWGASFCHLNTVKLQFSRLGWSAPKGPLFWSCPLFLDLFMYYFPKMVTEKSPVK